MSQVINCLSGKLKYKYSKAVRLFALTIDDYSPRTYRYIREKFNRCLPHPSTLKKYYVNSGANGEPGISLESIRTLSFLVKEFEDSGKKFFCSLTFDEMFIRPNIQYIDAQKKFQGFITYGAKEGCELRVAKCAIVLMINGINVNISLPIAHHFITALNKEDKANLILSVITAITETGAKIINVTCDGLQANFSMFQYLGASFKLNEMRPYFMNPVTGEKIFIILDACHMLKLVRNCLFNHGTLHDGKNQAIKWQYFERLEKARVDREFIRHKLTKRHIECDRNKMNVSLASQTLSRSVAKAMEFLMEAGKPDFTDCEGTIKYARQFNDLFDILNTGHNDNLQNNNNNKYKVPLSQATASHVLPSLDSFADYITSLKLNDVNILNSTKKTGFLGFLIDITVLRSVYEEYVETGVLNQIPTFHMSQDPLESFFGRIRSKCGNNDNPTVEQFKSAYRKTLVNKEFTAPVGANCKDNLKILSVSSTHKINVLEAESDINDFSEHLEEFEPFNTADNVLDAYAEATVCQIASDIEKKIRCQANFECTLCSNILNENEKVPINIFEGEQEKYRPCVSSVHICKVAKKYLDIFKTRIKFDYTHLISTIKKQLKCEQIFMGSDFSKHSDHKQYFISYIIEEFVRIRATCIARDLTMNEQDKLLRNKLNKRVHLRG